MLFLCNSRVRPGVPRGQVIEGLTRKIDQEDWELIKKGTISHWLYKVGEQPGMTVLLDCADMEEARRLVDAAPVVRDGILEFDIDPVNQFPRFD